ncbi:MAG: hypothetical protein KBT11_04295 [Treponema sp.]|nr:hypothetical protein [Candidatus Treponema equifaecale]
MKKRLLGIGIIAALSALFFTGCGDGDDGDSQYKGPETEMATILFDKNISCKYFGEEIQNGGSVDLGSWYMTFEAKEYKRGDIVFWSLNGKKMEPTDYGTYTLREFGTDYCKKENGKYQLKVEVTVREPYKPAIYFDETNFDCYSYSGYSSECDVQIYKGDLVSEGKMLRFAPKNPEKIITSYAINDGDAETKYIDVYQDVVSIKNVMVEEKIIWGDEGSGPYIVMDITTRDLVKAVLDISDENIICKKGYLPLYSTPLKNGDEVKENEVLKFYSNKRGLIVDSYNLNGTEKSEHIYEGYVTGITVSEDTVKDGKLKFEFNTHAALFAKVKIEADTPCFKIIQYSSGNELKSTEAVTDGYVTLYEGDTVNFYTDDTFTKVLTNCSINDKPLGEYGYGGKLLKNNDGELVMFIGVGRQEFPSADGYVFKKPAN